MKTCPDCARETDEAGLCPHCDPASASEVTASWSDTFDVTSPSADLLAQSAHAVTTRPGLGPRESTQPITPPSPFLGSDHPTDRMRIPLPGFASDVPARAFESTRPAGVEEFQPPHALPLPPMQVSPEPPTQILAVTPAPPVVWVPPTQTMAQAPLQLDFVPAQSIQSPIPPSDLGTSLPIEALESAPLPPDIGSTPPAPPAKAAPRAINWRLGALATAVLVVAAVGIMLSWPGRSVPAPQTAPTPTPGRAAPLASPPARDVPSKTRPASESPSSSSLLAAPLSSAPKWTLTPQPKWASDKQKTISFELEAENEVAVWMKHVRPMLAVRCLSRLTEVFVVTESAASFESLADRHTVQIGFDDTVDVPQHWVDSSTHRELFAPDGVELARQIAGAQRMRFKFTPFNSSPVVAEFDVRGFSGPLQSVAKACGWWAKPRGV
jgi:hypothetical protein